MLKGDVFRRIVMRDWSASHDSIHSVFVNEESNSMLMSVFMATEEVLGAFRGRKFFQRTSQSPRMFHLYLFISCVRSSTFPAALSDLTFQVPIVM